MKILCAILLASCSQPLYGCFPNLAWYPEITAPSDATRFADGSNGRPGEPMSLVYYPYHDIYISVNPTHLRLGLHIAPGTTVEVNGSIIRLQGRTKTGLYDESFELRADQHPSFSKPPHAFYPDTRSANYGFGPLKGDRKQGALIWYRYNAVNAADSMRVFVLPPDLLSGSITLPSLTINGTRYEPQILPFKNAFFHGVLTII